MAVEPKSPARVLRARDVCKRVGFAGTSGLYRAMEREGFPRPIRLGERQVGWLVCEIDDWIDRAVTARNDCWQSLGRSECRK
jgi:prophage regulatory protein